jgi:hypothetical protein
MREDRPGDVDLDARRRRRMTGIRSEMGGSVVERVIQCHVAAGRGVAVLIADVLQEVGKKKSQTRQAASWERKFASLTV